jgi:transposase
MWLTGRLAPDFKTIANFRKDNGKATRNVCRQFVVVCQQLAVWQNSTRLTDRSPQQRDRGAFVSTTK